MYFPSVRRELPRLLIAAVFLLAGCSQAPQPTIGQDSVSSAAEPDMDDQSLNAMPAGLTPELLLQFQNELNQQAGQMMQAGSAMSGEQASQMMLELQRMMQPPPQ
ncbi:hypothetical protein HZA87_02720 [Candidatus Uhrbacteria bacterium]|nr:hypothetical protein [Candidatus Uhrbacteria bacterium]